MNRPNPLPLGLIEPLAVLALVVGVAGCGHQTVPPLPEGTSVEIAEVSRAAGTRLIKATGTISWSREAALSFRIPGIMSGLSADVGDHVRAGQRIAVLDARDAAARQVQARAELGQAERDLARLNGLVEAGAISRQQYDAARTRAESARAAYQATAFDERSARLISPASGIVLTRSAQRGEVVQPGQPIITLADVSSALVLRVPVADRDIARIRIGSSATIAADALGASSIVGQVSRIGQQAGSQSGAIEVEITLPRASGLQSGMVASASIAAVPMAGDNTYLRVPAEAILEANGTRAFVMRYDAGARVARRTAVTFGGFDGDVALIGGLGEGVRVITGGAGYIADGDRVIISTPSQ